MKHFGILLIAIHSISLLKADINWQQPPVGCIEDFVYTDSLENLNCPDLTSLENPTKDWPTQMSAEERTQWETTFKIQMSLCRALEVKRRGETPWTQWSWMKLLAQQNLSEKINSIYQASSEAAANHHGRSIPPQILYGALTQESLLSDLGIEVDGGNYSCGIGQINIMEYCQWAQSLSLTAKKIIAWPSNGVDCNRTLISEAMVEPIYKKGLERMAQVSAPESLPDYRLRPEHMSTVTLQEILPALPEAALSTQQLRFQMIRSFVTHCSDYRTGIPAKAFQLNALFQNSVPSSLRTVGMYSEGDTFLRSCRQPYRSRYQPLQTGWLLADAIYNAGQRAATAVEYYFQIASQQPFKLWTSLTALDLIEAFHWSGKAVEGSSQIIFKDSAGNDVSWKWFKACVLQRHIARVIQYVTLPGQTIATSLEQGGCKPNTYTPDYRLKGSGIYPAP